MNFDHHCPHFTESMRFNGKRLSTLPARTWWVSEAACPWPWLFPQWKAIGVPWDTPVSPDLELKGWNRLLALLLHLYFTAAVSNTNSNYVSISPCSAPGIKHSLYYKDYLLSISRAKLWRDRAWKLRQLRNSLQVTAMVCSLWGQNLNMVLQNLFWTEPCGSTHRFSSQTNGVQISTLLFTSCVTLEKSLNDSLS